MANYIVSSVEKYANYVVLRLSPQETLAKLQFVPGQYATISFKKRGKWSPARCFSLVGSPSQTELTFAMRLKGRFTRQVAHLTKGETVKVQGPYGSFTLDPDYDKRIIMLAAGIGITPMLSILKRASETKLANPMTLFYACKSLADVPFYEEIKDLEKSNPHFKAYFFVSNGESDKTARVYSQRLKTEVINQYTNGDFNRYSYFICGPKHFNKTFSQYLDAKAIDSDKIITESFTQVTKLGWNFGLFKPTMSSLTYTATSLALVAGFAFFMLIDLVRYVPKVQAKSPAQTSNPSTSSSSTTPSTNYSSTNTSATQPQTSSNYSQSYTPPVSTVS